MAKLIGFGPTAFFWLFALGAQMSGYANPWLAAILVAAGTIWLFAWFRWSNEGQAFLRGARSVARLPSRQPDISLSEAYRILSGVAPFDRTQDRLYQQLVEGKISAWGRMGLNRSKNPWTQLGPETLIPADYWTDSTLDWITIAATEREEAQSSEKTKPAHGKREYRKVRFNSDQIRRLASELGKQA